MLWAFLVAQLVKISACNTGDTTSVPGSGRSPWRRERLPTPVFMGFPGGSDGKESTCNVGDLGLIPGLGRSPGGGRSNPVLLPEESPWTEEPGRL